jgi:chromosome segregation ATPase
MFDSAGTLFNIIIAILTLSALAAGAAAVFRANYAKSQIEFLERDVEIRNGRISVLESENASMASDIALEKQKVLGLTQQIKVLEDIVTGKEQLDSIQRSLDTYAKQNNEVHTAILHNQEELLKTLRRISPPTGRARP